jgi:hypothetical protein
MRRRTAVVVSVLAGVCLGALSNWIYDLLKDVGFFPEQLTLKAVFIVVVAALPLVILVVLPEVVTRGDSSGGPGVRIRDAKSRGGGLVAEDRTGRGADVQQVETQGDIRVSSTPAEAGSDPKKGPPPT